MFDRGDVGHGHSLFEELVAVPFVLKYPGNQDAGTRLPGPAALIDVLPTVLAAVGSEAPANLDGVDLRGSSPVATRPLFFDLNLLLRGERYVMDGVRLGRHKWVDQVEPRSQHLLFDVVDDPGERKAQTRAEPGLEERLGGLLRDFRASARSGLQLVFVGDDQEQARAATIRLRTDGRFVELRGIELEGEDAATLADDRQSLTLEFVLASRPNPTGGRPRILVDSDRIAVEVEPSGAQVVIEAARLGSEPAQIFLGAELRNAGAAPLAFQRDDPELAVERMDTLLPITKQRSVIARPGLYVTTIAPAGSEVAIDAETERRLRELGYVE
jgi:hypothetical protein